MDKGSPDPIQEDPAARSRLSPETIELVYDELRTIARRTLEGWSPQQTLQATALVHEAWLRLTPQPAVQGLDRKAFIAAAALSIRRILVEHYRSKRTLRKGGDRERVPLVDSLCLDRGPALDLTVLDEALEALASINQRKARVVELRFFGGLEEGDIAEVLGVSPRTVSTDWRFARAWLRDRLRRKIER